MTHFDCSAWIVQRDVKAADESELPQHPIPETSKRLCSGRPPRRPVQWVPSLMQTTSGRSQFEGRTTHLPRSALEAMRSPELFSLADPQCAPDRRPLVSPGTRERGLRTRAEILRERKWVVNVFAVEAPRNVTRIDGKHSRLRSLHQQETESLHEPGYTLGKFSKVGEQHH